jgi:thymidylate synthase ThyX
MTSVQIVTDTTNAISNSRLVSFLVEFPRIINAEVLRHRALSFSSASSRAIPTKKIIKSIEENPYIPKVWGSNKAGMQAGEPLIDEKAEFAENKWFKHLRSSICIASELAKLGVHKQIVNRILEPFQHIKLLISGTEWDNFFELRISEFAQPEIYELAYEMKMLMDSSDSRRVYPVFVDSAVLFSPDIMETVNPASAHIPFRDSDIQSDTMYVSAARCARLSYSTHDGKFDREADISLAFSLVRNKHWSPFEHIAFPIAYAYSTDIPKTFRSNFDESWLQFRKILEYHPPE